MFNVTQEWVYGDNEEGGGGGLKFITLMHFNYFNLADEVTKYINYSTHELLRYFYIYYKWYYNQRFFLDFIFYSAITYVSVDFLF